MDTVIVPRDARLSRHENALVVTSDAGRKAIPLNGVKHVVCMGDGSISIRLLKDMGRRGIRFTVLDAGGRFLGAFEPEDETPSGRVRIGQAALFLDEAVRLRIARLIVEAQVKSMRGLLQRYRRNGTAGLDASLDGIESALDLTRKAESIEGLMGVEGQARAFLHDAFKAISEDARLDRRIRRPPPDPVNCLMSFFNMMLYSACANELAKTHLDRSISFLPRAGDRAEIPLDRHGRDLPAGLVGRAAPVPVSPWASQRFVVRPDSRGVPSQREGENQGHRAFLGAHRGAEQRTHAPAGDTPAVSLSGTEGTWNRAIQAVRLEGVTHVRDGFL